MIDFLVSYTGEDRDWAEWIASHLGALGYAYALQEPPSGAGADPFRAADEAVASGQDVIVILSYAFVNALRASGAAEGGHLEGPGRAVTVQIEALDPPADLAGRPTARMHEAADDYSTSPRPPPRRGQGHPARAGGGARPARRPPPQRPARPGSAGRVLSRPGATSRTS